MIPLLVVQSLISLLMDAILLNMVYTRFSTASTRSPSIMFTNVAVVYCENDSVKISFRVCEVARKPLIEPQVRMYLIRHSRSEVKMMDYNYPEGCLDVEVFQMPLEEPNGSIADGKLFLTLPSRVVHCLNSSSPLCSAKTLDQFHDALRSIDFFELIVVLSATCPITGSSLEARQSYTQSDLRFDCRFAPCVELHNNEHVVNFEQFQETIRITQGT